MTYFRNIKKMAENRQCNLDILRLLACFWVIVNHTVEGITVSYTEGYNYYMAAWLFAMCRTAVPLFVMISGAVLIPKNESLGSTIRRAARTTSILLSFSVIYYLLYIREMSSSFSIRDYIYIIWTGEATNAFWYMYLYIALLVMLPMYRAIAQGISDKGTKFFYFSVWLCFFGIIPLIQNQFKITELTKYFDLCLLSGYSMFLLLGHELNNNMNKKKIDTISGLRGIFLFTAISFVETAIYCYMRKNGIESLLYDDRLYITIAIPSIVLFYAINCFSIESTRVKMVLTCLGDLTFGTYLLSDLLIKVCWPVYEKAMVNHDSFTSMIIYELSVYLAGMAITLIMKILYYQLFNKEEIMSRICKIKGNS